MAAIAIGIARNTRRNSYHQCHLFGTFASGEYFAISNETCSVINDVLIELTKYLLKHYSRESNPRYE